MGHKWTPSEVSLKCAVCGLEIGLSTIDCCGRPVTGDEKIMIRNGDLEYRDGKWRTYVTL